MGVVDHSKQPFLPSSLPFFFSSSFSSSISSPSSTPLKKNGKIGIRKRDVYECDDARAMLWEIRGRAAAVCVKGSVMRTTTDAMGGH